MSNWWGGLIALKELVKIIMCYVHSLLSELISINSIKSQHSIGPIMSQLIFGVFCTDVLHS